jgi:hypothetical protein
MRFNKVYVVAPYAVATGGGELSHQLVDSLRNKGIDAYIAYTMNGQISHSQDVTKEYTNYNIATTGDIEDNKDNILVLPEISYHLILDYHQITIGCWWMSVDNHYIDASAISLGDMLCYHKGLLKTLKIIYKFLFRGFYRSGYSDKVLKKEENRIYHFYQSCYAQQHLYSKGFSKVIPLSDYINTEFEISVSDEKGGRNDIILYNPMKGYEFTQKIIKNTSQYKFVPLKGYNRQQLCELMQHAKLYIDFGNFPGKDRLSREAAMNGCCIITGKLGASYFYEDVPIGEEYKFEVEVRNIKQISQKIDDIMKNYSSHNLQFEQYRSTILKEKNTFYRQVEDFFL